ncbi:MAG TPA: GDP-mannose 4,6-dehydratase [Gaiellaceae bacterium]|nr:GDP-mannose 4,6-dehydratase [Gaiellaceae bacterium]
MTGPVLVTGGQGFVGAHLLRLLVEAAAPEADVTDPVALRAAVHEVRPSAVVHLAALSNVAESFRDPAGVWQVNAIGTVNLLEAVRAECPDARVLVVSTGEVYGDADVVPTPESEGYKPRSPYAASKAAAELAAGQSGLDVVVARAFQHEGPGRDDRFAIGSWTSQLAELELAGGGMLRVGNLDVERDITDVRDVCRAYRALLDRDVPPGVYNVASGRAVSLREVLDRLVALCRVPVSVEADPDRMRASDVAVVCGDPSKLRAATGWQPEIALERTLADTLETARERATTGRMPS